MMLEGRLRCTCINFRRRGQNELIIAFDRQHHGKIIDNSQLSKIMWILTRYRKKMWYYVMFFNELIFNRRVCLHVHATPQKSALSHALSLKHLHVHCRYIGTMAKAIEKC